MTSTDIQYALLGEVEGKRLCSLKSTSVKYIGLLSKGFHFTTQRYTAEGCMRLMSASSPSPRLASMKCTFGLGP